MNQNEEGSIRSWRNSFKSGIRKLKNKTFESNDKNVNKTSDELLSRSDENQSVKSSKKSTKSSKTSLKITKNANSTTENTQSLPDSIGIQKITFNKLDYSPENVLPRSRPERSDPIHLKKEKCDDCEFHFINVSVKQKNETEKPKLFMPKQVNMSNQEKPMTNDHLKLKYVGIAETWLDENLYETRIATLGELRSYFKTVQLANGSNNLKNKSEETVITPTHPSSTSSPKMKCIGIAETWLDGNLIETRIVTLDELQSYFKTIQLSNSN